MRSFLYATTALVSLVFATTAEAGIGCTPPPTGGSAPRLDTMVADSVDITGGCISGTINGQTYYAPAFRGAVSKQYCTWDATHDVGDCINAAIAAARVGGGKVAIPAGTYGLTTTISQSDTTGIEIHGAGGDGHHGICKTKLKWIGSSGGTMVQIGTDAASTRVVDGGLVGVCLDGNSLAATGLSTRSVVGSHLRELSIFSVTGTAWDHGVSTTANVGTTENRVYDIYISVTGSAKGLKWSGTATNNVHHDRWYNLHIQHADGTGFECGNSDSNVIVGYYAQRVSGSGLSLDLLASDTVDNECRANYFFAAEPQGGVTARATGFSQPSSDNYIQIIKESANIIPTVESGATLLCENNQGNQCGTQLGTYTFGLLTAKVNADPTAVVYRPSSTANHRTSLDFALNDSNSAQQTYARVGGFLMVNTAGAFSGALSLYTANAGTLTEHARIINTGGLQFGTGAIGNNTVCAGCILLGNNTAFEFEDSAGTTREALRWDASNVLTIAGGTGGVALKDNNGSSTIATSDGSGNLTFANLAKLKNYTVAALPTCNAGNKYALAAVSDANAPTYNATVAGGGAVAIPVMCDGTNWTAH